MGNVTVLPRYLLVLIAGYVVVASACSTADLRSDELRKNGLTDETVTRGRALLEKAAREHGLSAWRSHRTLEIVARDTWAGGWIAQGWWPQLSQQFRMQMAVGTFTSRVELIGGPAAGEIWGVQSWRGYRKPGSGEPHEESEADVLTFYLPTLHYFTELPFRLLEADVAAYAGSRSHRGKIYDLVLVTWNELRPQLTVDQYLLWIDRSSGRIEKCRYTLRDAFDWAAGTIHFEDFRNVGGIEIPFEQTVTLEPVADTEYPLSEHFFHRLVIEEAAFDRFDRDLLSVRDELPLADRKPAGYNPLDPLEEAPR